MYKKILVPIDLSNKNLAQSITEKAVAMAQSQGSELHMLAIFPEYGSSWVADFFTGDHQKQALHKLGEELTKFVETHVPSDLTCRPHVVHGSVYEEVIGAAEKLSCDLIVLGAHRPELSDYLLGPNAARVVRHAKASVLVVRNL